MRHDLRSDEPEGAWVHELPNGDHLAPATLTSQMAQAARPVHPPLQHTSHLDIPHRFGIMALMVPMASSHLIDPDGDVVLLLRLEGELRLDWNFATTPAPSSLGYRRGAAPAVEADKGKEIGRNWTSVWSFELAQAPGLEPKQARLSESPLAPDTDEMIVRVRTSSKHLILASPYFKRSLEGELAEADTLRSKGHVEVDMSGQDPDTMLLVMNIIHGRFRRLPPSVDLIALTRVAALVDYLGCHEVVEPFARKWIEQMKGNITETYSKELLQWLCISQVFAERSLFKDVTRVAIHQARDVIDRADLPIRESIEYDLNQQRSATINKLLSGLEGILQDLLYDRNQCDYQCNALRYGTLVKEVAPRGLHSPTPQAPFLGLSFENIASSIIHIQDTPYPRLGPGRRGVPSCALNPQIKTLIQQIKMSSEGLSLRPFVT